MTAFPKIHYTVVKRFTDHNGVVHFPGEIAELYRGRTFGVLANDEIPLMFHNCEGFMGVKEDYIEEELCKQNSDLTA